MPTQRGCSVSILETEWWPEKWLSLDALKSGVEKKLEQLWHYFPYINNIDQCCMYCIKRNKKHSGVSYAFIYFNET